MTLAPTRLAVLALLCVAAGLPARADSLASSASSAGSASSGASSASLTGSSNSSAKTVADVTDGDYRIVAVTLPADRPEHLRLQLQATADASEAGTLYLTLPHAAAAPRGLVAGDVVSARQRPYGLEFARSDTREAFFLVLEDAWHRELAAHPVAL